MRRDAFLDGMLDSLCLRALTWHAQVREHALRKSEERHRSMEMFELAEEAYLYGYPLVLMDQTARAADLTPRSIASPFPNVSALCTSAFIDLRREPWLLTLPDTGGRYYFISLLDAYTNVFASLGKRTTGTAAQEFAILGPNWKGTLPLGMKAITAPSNLVWVRGQTRVDGDHDLSAVFALTSRYGLRPLSERSDRRSYLRVDPTFSTRAAPAKLLSKLSDRAFFERLSGLLVRHPPPPRDAGILKRFERIGLRPGAFSPPLGVARAIAGTGRRARKRLRARAPAEGVRGWVFDPPLGDYDTLYFERAAAALWSFGANLPEDAVCVSTSSDAHGRALDGRNDYVLHIDAAHEPSTYAFWSLCMYDRHGHVVSNPIERYALGQSDALVRNLDGSLDICIQREPPRGRWVANWLPAPDGPYQLTLRIYAPDERVLSGAWVPPGVQRRPPRVRLQLPIRNAPNAAAS